ncbi:MAG: hypothetical protein ACI80N_003294, partial [Gammaproteobacteria bacterium]
MKFLLRLAVVATTVPFAVSSPCPVAGNRSGVDAFYRSSVDKALERARADLQQSITLHQDHSSWSDPWVVQQGPFVVRSTASWFFSDQAARNLDTMVGHFEALLDRPFPRDENRNVFVFPDIDGYNSFGGNYGIHSSILGSFYAGQDPQRPIVSYYHNNPTQVGMWLTHSASHMYVTRLAARELPAWMDEGLASYFAYYFWAYSYGIDELARLAANGNLTSLSELLGARFESYTTANSHERFVQLGLLFAYLIHHYEPSTSPLDEVREGSFVEYLQKAMRGERLTRHPMHALIENPSAELEPAFRAFSFPR